MYSVKCRVHNVHWTVNCVQYRVWISVQCVPYTILSINLPTGAFCQMLTPHSTSFLSTPLVETGLPWTSVLCTFSALQYTLVYWTAIHLNWRMHCYRHYWPILNCISFHISGMFTVAALQYTRYWKWHISFLSTVGCAVMSIFTEFCSGDTAAAELTVGK